MGHLFSRPCLCPGLVLEMQLSTPPRETVIIVIVIVVIVYYAVKLRRGRLNYVGGEISPETDLRYTKIFENFATVFSHNIYVMGHLFSRPCLCPGLVLEMQFSTPPRKTTVVVVILSLVKLRGGRLNYVGGGFPENRF